MRKKCPKCASKSVELFGRTTNKKQRFRCKACGSVYIWQERADKKNRERVFFKRWVKEGYSIRQLASQSGWGETKIKCIKAYWLS